MFYAQRSDTVLTDLVYHMKPTCQSLGGVVVVAVVVIIVVIQFLYDVVPLSEMAGFTPFLLQLLALRLSTKEICRKSSSLFILYNSFYQPARWNGRNGYVSTLTSQ